MSGVEFDRLWVQNDRVTDKLIKRIWRDRTHAFCAPRESLYTGYRKPSQTSSQDFPGLLAMYTSEMTRVDIIPLDGVSMRALLDILHFAKLPQPQDLKCLRANGNFRSCLQRAKIRTSALFS